MRGEPEGTPQREGGSSSDHLLSSGGQIAKQQFLGCLSIGDCFLYFLAHFDQGTLCLRG